MSINLSFHGTKKVHVRKNEATETVWYNVYFHTDNYMGGTREHEISVFCGSGVTSLSPFEEMWQAQEAERLAEEKRINDEEDAAHAEIARVEFGTDPDLAAKLTEGTAPVDPRFDTLEEEHIDASR